MNTEKNSKIDRGTHTRHAGCQIRASRRYGYGLIGADVNTIADRGLCICRRRTEIR